MALATSLEPWEKELQQAVNTCDAWRETQALVWLPACPPPPIVAHKRARATHLQVLERHLGLAVKHLSVVVHVVYRSVLSNDVVHLDVGAAQARARVNAGEQICCSPAHALANLVAAARQMRAHLYMMLPNILLLRRSLSMAGVRSGWVAPRGISWLAVVAWASALAAATSSTTASAFFSTSVTTTPPASGLRSGMTLRGIEHAVSCWGCRTTQGSAACKQLRQAHSALLSSSHSLSTRLRIRGTPITAEKREMPAAAMHAGAHEQMWPASNPSPTTTHRRKWRSKRSWHRQPCQPAAGEQEGTAVTGQGASAWQRCGVSARPPARTSLGAFWMMKKQPIQEVKNAIRGSSHSDSL